MIRAIIFDCFGVLTNEGFGSFRSYHFTDDQYNKLQANQAMGELNLGSINYNTFLQKLANLSGETVRKVDEQLSRNLPNKELFTYIREKLKNKYKIGLLSNAGGNWLEEMFEKSDVELFDDIVLSYEHRIIKPSREIFQLSAKRLGVKLEECLLADDNQKHIEGAKKFGMKAILYQNFDQFKRELEEIIS